MGLKGETSKALVATAHHEQIVEREKKAEGRAVPGEPDVETLVDAKSGDLGVADVVMCDISILMHECGGRFSDSKDKKEPMTLDAIVNQYLYLLGSALSDHHSRVVVAVADNHRFVPKLKAVEHMKRKKSVEAALSKTPTPTVDAASVVSTPSTPIDAPFIAIKSNRKVRLHILSRVIARIVAGDTPTAPPGSTVILDVPVEFVRHAVEDMDAFMGDAPYDEAGNVCIAITKNAEHDTTVERIPEFDSLIGEGEVRTMAYVCRVKEGKLARFTGPPRDERDGRYKVAIRSTDTDQMVIFIGAARSLMRDSPDRETTRMPFQFGVVAFQVMRKTRELCIHTVDRTEKEKRALRAAYAANKANKPKEQKRILSLNMLYKYLFLRWAESTARAVVHEKHVAAAPPVGGKRKQEAAFAPERAPTEEEVDAACMDREVHHAFQAWMAFVTTFKGNDYFKTAHAPGVNIKHIIRGLIVKGPCVRPEGRAVDARVRPGTAWPDGMSGMSFLGDIASGLITPRSESCISGGLSGLLALIGKKPSKKRVDILHHAETKAEMCARHAQHIAYIMNAYLDPQTRHGSAWQTERNHFWKPHTPRKRARTSPE